MKNEKIYVLSCDTVENNGGIYAYRLTKNAKLEQTDYLPCDRPMYAVKCEKGLCVLLRAPFTDNNISGYFYTDMDLKNKTDIKSTNGLVACHLCVIEDNVYTANYSSGSVSKNDSKTDQRKGCSVHSTRQSAPHVHFVGRTPDGLLVVCDLGTDTLAIYDNDLSLVSEEKVPSGYGIRHLVFSKDNRFIYSINELVPSVSVFSYNCGKASYIDTFKFDCKNPNANGGAIRISDDGKTLYVSLREENVICILSADNEKLTLTSTVDCGGICPRDINIFGGRLICCNQLSNTLSVIDLSAEAPSAVDLGIAVSQPLCVL